MTGHVHITGRTWADATLTLDGEKLPLEIKAVGWRLDPGDVPVLTLDIMPDRLTVDFTTTWTTAPADD